MLLKRTILYLPAQVVGPLFQLVAMIVWTHVVNEHTLGVITLITATHELLQLAFLAWWSQYALRFFGRYHEGEEAERFYRTENVVILLSLVLQSAAVVAVLYTVIATDTNPMLLGLLLIETISPAPEWPLLGYAAAQLFAALIVLPKIGYSRRIWPIDREIIRHALGYGIPLIFGGALGWVGLNASRFVVNDMLGVAAAGLFAVGYGLGQRAAAVAAMLVTAAAFPLAVKSMEQNGSQAAMRQLSDNGALLLGILAPSIAGIFLLRAEIVHLLIAAPFQTVTLAILPLSTLAGSIRNIRAHFGDQVFLLQSKTRLMVVVSAIDAVVTIIASLICIHFWGLVGAAAATVISAVAAASVSFALGFTRFGLTLPWTHIARIAIATLAMAMLLTRLPEAKSYAVLAAHIASGAAIYVVVLAVLYGPTLLRMVRRQPRFS